MADKYLVEAFQALNELNEDVFDVTADGAKQLQDYVSDDLPDTNVEDIIDPLAQTEEDLQDSYIGKVILDCSICQSKIYKDPSEVEVNEDGTLANVGDECPYCRSCDGFKIIGEVAPYSKTDVDVEVTPKEDGSEEAKVDLTNESCKTESCKTKKGEDKLKSMKKEQVNEDLNGITIDTDKETINVTTTEKAEDGEEMIAPISDNVKAEISTEPSEDESDFEDVDMDEFDEEEFDGLGESYLKRVYENVASYKTSKAALKGNKIKLEGVITFKSGKKVNTSFMFEASTVTKRGKLKFLGENKQFAKGRKSFTLTGRADGKKLVCESLTYNYRAKDANGQSKRIYGRVVR